MTTSVKPNPIVHEWINREQAALLAQVSVVTIDRLVKRQAFESYRPKWLRQRRIVKASFMAWLAGQ